MTMNSRFEFIISLLFYLNYKIIPYIPCCFQGLYKLKGQFVKKRGFRNG